MELMQTKDAGSPISCLWPGASQDHAGMPVMLPRDSDAKMRRDGPSDRPTVPSPSLSAEECTAHQTLARTPLVACDQWLESNVADEQTMS
jgi:hypothetical protein